MKNLKYDIENKELIDFPRILILSDCTKLTSLEKFESVCGDLDPSSDYRKLTSLGKFHSVGGDFYR